jgi:phosphoglycerate dehydrogenase-like enzyme
VNVLVAIYSQFAMWNIPFEYIERLAREFASHRFLHAVDDAGAERHIVDAEVAFSSQVTREQLTAARALRWIHSPAAGVGGMLFREMIEHPVVITNSRGMSADTMAEHVLAVTLALFRRLPAAFDNQARREWAQDAIGLQGNRTIAGSRVLVVGLGAIGCAVARRMALLGAIVTGIRRQMSAPPIEGISAVVPPERLHEALPDADVVIVSAPHTPHTRRLIGTRELQLMSPKAILVNVSRGQLIDDAALVAAVQQGQIEGAALDVFEQEPLPPDSPVWTLPNVLITPHTSGFRLDHWDAAVAIFSENLRRYESGREMLNRVDKSAGY